MKALTNYKVGKQQDNIYHNGHDLLLLAPLDAPFEGPKNVFATIVQQGVVNRRHKEASHTSFSRSSSHAEVVEDRYWRQCPEFACLLLVILKAACDMSLRPVVHALEPDPAIAIDASEQVHQLLIGLREAVDKQFSYRRIDQANVKLFRPASIPRARARSWDYVNGWYW